MYMCVHKIYISVRKRPSESENGQKTLMAALKRGNPNALRRLSASLVIRKMQIETMVRHYTQVWCLIFKEFTVPRVGKDVDHVELIHCW